MNRENSCISENYSFNNDYFVESIEKKIIVDSIYFGDIKTSGSVVLLPKEYRFNVTILIEFLIPQINQNNSYIRVFCKYKNQYYGFCIGQIRQIYKLFEFDTNEKRIAIANNVFEQLQTTWSVYCDKIYFYPFEHIASDSLKYKEAVTWVKSLSNPESIAFNTATLNAATIINPEWVI